MIDEALREALLSSQRLGMLGDRSIGEVITHSLAFVEALVDVGGVVIDLGSGGGVPGLVVACARPDLQVWLVDRRAARADHLHRLVRRLGLTDRVAVVCTDASSWQPDAPVDAVVARGFGTPTCTALAAARLLRPGGLLVVSEPPGADGSRWAGVAGFELMPAVDDRVAVLRCST